MAAADGVGRSDRGDSAGNARQCLADDCRSYLPRATITFLAADQHWSTCRAILAAGQLTDCSAFRQLWDPASRSLMVLPISMN